MIFLSILFSYYSVLEVSYQLKKYTLSILFSYYSIVECDFQKAHWALSILFSYYCYFRLGYVLQYVLIFQFFLVITNVLKELLEMLFKITFNSF